MVATVKSLGIDKLPVENQLDLVHEIWDCIAAAGKLPPLSDAQLQELRRRVAEDNANPNDTIPWEEVKARALNRVRK